MKLRAYLKEKKHTQMSFIEEIEMATGQSIPQGTLAKWILEVRIPRKEEMHLLFNITEGKVQPNDFYGISPVNIKDE
tara:strand:+ start:278 stop:508 length:231 start_codon:yes stop_codon:yes gene_type:complete